MTVIKPDGSEELAPPVMRVVDKVRHVEDIQKADFEYLKSRVSPGRTPKVTIPSPTMLHFRGGRAGISREAYPELEPAFYDDVARAYGEELRSLADAGCTYVQMDDTNLAYLCDEKMREAARSRGDDPNELPHRYAGFINKVVAQKPAGMTLAMHLCRGNFKSTHAAAGNYEPVAEALLAEMNLDAYFLEYDDDRSGDFRPLRFLPKGKIVVLGLVTTKFGEMEVEGHAQAPHRRGLEVRAARAALPLAAVRLLEHGARQQHRGRGAARQAAPGGRSRRRGLGQRLTTARSSTSATSLAAAGIPRGGAGGGRSRRRLPAGVQARKEPRRRRLRTRP